MQNTQRHPPEPAPSRYELFSLFDAPIPVEWISLEWLLDRVEGRAEGAR